MASKEDPILRLALKSGVVRMCRDADARWMDAKRRDEITPADLGEHLPIPDEAVMVESVDDAQKNFVKSDWFYGGERKSNEQESS